MKLKICQIRDRRSAFQLVDAGVDYLGFHVLEITDSEAQSRSAAINRELRASGFAGGVLLTKASDPGWIVGAARTGMYRYVQVHRDVGLEDVADLANRLHECGSLLIQVVDPAIHDVEYVSRALQHAEYVLFDNYNGGTGRRISYADLASMPMERAFIAGGIDDARAREMGTRFSPYAIDVQSWVKRPDKSKDMDKVATLVEIASSLP